MSEGLQKFNVAPQYEADGYDYFWQPPDWTITDPNQQIVEGYASLPNLDDQGDIIPLDVIDAALPKFMEWGNLREMHDKKAAGKVIAAVVDERGLKIMAKIQDPIAWAKVKSGVYQGFSVGGDIPEDATEKRADGARIIKQVLLNEISLVDRPANPKARISVVKMEKHFTGKVHKHRCEKHQKEDCQECGCDRLVEHPEGTGESSGMAEKFSESEARDDQGEWTKRRARVGERNLKRDERKEREKERHTRKAADLDKKPAEGKREYGNVRFADPAHGKYPIDTPKHVRAALSYWGMPKNRSGYSAEQQKQISARIHAAARRFGIGGNKTQKGITMTTLEKVKATLVDPEEIQKLEAAQEIIAKASSNEWHTQRDVGNPKSEAEVGVDLEDNNAGEEEPVEDFIKASDGEEEEACKASDGEDGEDMGKASGGCMSHMNACHKALQACHKALDDGHPAKPHCVRAIDHIQSAKKCFGKSEKAAEAASLSKALGSENNELLSRVSQLEEALDLVVTKHSNQIEYLAKMIGGLPRSRPLPPEVVSRDDDNPSTLQNARLALARN